MSGDRATARKARKSHLPAPFNKETHRRDAMKMKKFDFHVAFKVRTDITNIGVDIQIPNINLGYYSIDIDVEDFQYLIAKHPESYSLVEEKIKQDYRIEKQNQKELMLEDYPKEAELIDSGFVYFIKVITKDVFKIGISRCDVDARIHGIQTSCPYPLEVYSKSESSQCGKDERWFHQFFRKYKMVGEWFNVSQPMIDHAMELRFSK